MAQLDRDSPGKGKRRNAGVTHDAIESIRELIASGEWGPGTRLPREADLAAQLGLSRNSLREAVRALSLARVLEVRRMLEPEAAAMAALRADDDIKIALRRELDRMFDAGDRVEDLVEADAAFHDVIGQAPGNAVLRSLLQSLSTRTVRARLWHGMADHVALDLARAEHTRIYEANVARDPDLARAATTMHIASNEHWLREHLGPADDVPLEGDAAAD